MSLVHLGVAKIQKLFFLAGGAHEVGGFGLHLHGEVACYVGEGLAEGVYAEGGGYMEGAVDELVHPRVCELGFAGGVGQDDDALACSVVGEGEAAVGLSALQVVEGLEVGVVVAAYDVEGVEYLVGVAFVAVVEDGYLPVGLCEDDVLACHVFVLFVDKIKAVFLFGIPLLSVSLVW